MARSHLRAYVVTELSCFQYFRRYADGPLLRCPERYQLEAVRLDDALLGPDPDPEGILTRDERVEAMAPSRVVQRHLQLEDVALPTRRR